MNMKRKIMRTKWMFTIKDEHDGMMGYIDAATKVMKQYQGRITKNHSLQWQVILQSELDYVSTSHMRILKQR
jgi:hypothetical protein